MKLSANRICFDPLKEEARNDINIEIVHNPALDGSSWQNLAFFSPCSDDHFCHRLLKKWKKWLLQKCIKRNQGFGQLSVEQQGLFLTKHVIMEQKFSSTASENYFVRKIWKVSGALKLFLFIWIVEKLAQIFYYIIHLIILYNRIKRLINVSLGIFLDFF